MSVNFDEVIESRDRLREIIGEASERVLDKHIDHIDDICAKYIAASPYMIMATRGKDGLLDQSPKGDPAGFVKVLDSKTLVIPDRLGNRRIDSFENLMNYPEIALFFMIPGHEITLRVSGRAKLVLDKALQEEMAVNGKQPNLLVAMTVDEAFLHCAKSIARGNIWKPENWPDTSEVPSLAEGMVAHAKLPNVQKMQEIIDHDFETRMY